jgi:hypothetical protein
LVLASVTNLLFNSTNLKYLNQIKNCDLIPILLF